MQRRDLLRAAAATAALSLIPRDAQAAWARVGSTLAEPTNGAATVGTPTVAELTAAQRAVVAKLADTLIPRTDTIGALDVRVPAFIDVLVADYYDDNELRALTTGIDAIDALATSSAGVGFASLQGEALTRVMTALDQPADRSAPAAVAYARLKGVIAHGYLTSERVQKEVLKTNIMPGRYTGDAPYTAPRGAAAGGSR